MKKQFIEKGIIILCTFVGTIIAVTIFYLSLDHGTVIKPEVKEESSITSEKIQENDDKRVTFTTPDPDKYEYNYQYENAVLEAKKEAIAINAPEEYQDFIYIISTLDNLYVPSTLHFSYYEKSTDEERRNAIADYIGAISRANEIEEEMKLITKTVNNTEEYMKLFQTVKDIQALQAYVDEYKEFGENE